MILLLNLRNYSLQFTDSVVKILLLSRQLVAVGHATLIVVSEVLQLDVSFVQLLLQCRRIRLQVVNLKFLVPQFSPQRINLILELADVSDGCIVAHFEVPLLVDLLIIEQFVLVLKVLVLVKDFMIITFVLSQVVIISLESFDDDVFLIGLDAIGGSHELVAGGEIVFLSPCTLHANCYIIR